MGLKGLNLIELKLSRVLLKAKCGVIGVCVCVCV